VKPFLTFLGTLFFLLLPAYSPAQEDEIVANLAGGRAIIQVANDAILFAAIDHPLESKSVPPRVASVDNRHIGIFFGASEWQVPAQPRPIRLDQNIEHFSAPDPRYRRPDSAETDLEQIGLYFLEKLRPLVAQLHHKIDLKPDEPLFSLILIGYAPQAYGPEVWQLDYRVEQRSANTREGDFWETHILRPSFTQLYPPEKHAAKTLIEIRFPSNLQDTPLLGMIQQGDPRIAALGNSDQHTAKVIQQIERGEAQKSDPAAAGDFLRAALPIAAGNSTFILGKMADNGGFDWIVPPEEPVEKKTEDKNRPADAPTLNRRPKP
jgi:hypothetical protein